jgi:hypothetical protein
MYLGAGDTNYLEVERKSFDRTDYCDREIEKTISSGAYTSNTIRLTNTIGISVGDVVLQTQYLSIQKFNDLLLKLDMDVSIVDSDYFSLLEASNGDNMREKLEALATKLDADTGISQTTFSSSIANITKNISAVAQGSSAEITTTASHGLLTNRYVTIANSDSVPVIDGNFTITVTSATKFTIPFTVTTDGTTVGTVTTNVNSFEDIRACYNIIINLLNTDSNIASNNFTSISTSTSTEIETVVTAVNPITRTITLASALQYIVGPIVVMNAFSVDLTYAPITMGDVMNYKHLRQVTMMFLNKAFTSAKLKFSTDLMPEIKENNFTGSGNGIFGSGFFGSGFFGGGSNSAPYRTIIPRQCQRCRYLNLGFNHRIAREKVQILGVSVVGESYSERAYR